MNAYWITVSLETPEPELASELQSVVDQATRNWAASRGLSEPSSILREDWLSAGELTPEQVAAVDVEANNQKITTGPSYE